MSRHRSLQPLVSSCSTQPTSTIPPPRHSRCSHCQTPRWWSGRGGRLGSPAGRSRRTVRTDQSHSARRGTLDPERESHFKISKNAQSTCSSFCWTQCFLLLRSCFVSYLCIEVESDAVQHALSVRQRQRHAAVVGHAPWGHHQTLGRSGVWQGGAGWQAGHWRVTE